MIKMMITGDRGEFAGILTKSAIEAIIKTVLNPICIIFDWTGEFVPLEKEIYDKYNPLECNLRFSRIVLDNDFKNTILSNLGYFGCNIILLEAWAISDDRQQQLLEDIESFSKIIQKEKQRNVYLFFNKTT